MTSTLTPELDAAIREGFRNRDRDNMQPTIDYFHRLLDQHPGNPFVLYEVGGSYDTAGEEERARGYYEQAMDARLDGDALRRCLLQYGSTLRNLGLYDESLAALLRARAEFPESDSVRLFLALSLHAAGRSDAAVAELLELSADRIRTDEVTRYEAALRRNAAHLAELDGQANSRPRGLPG
ncbi:tetratricopeptide repeat protein [Pseudarthrobacter sp. S9]|uniref:tetratricopeptide repeat protein n=1 Tax=Pseudarthrobacter sp. S9 TaxID=3418421 RepID=UPI003D042F42